MKTISRNKNQFITLCLFVIFNSLSHSVVSCQENSQTAQINDKDVRPDKEPIKLPGLVIDFKNHCVDIEATVCLNNGFLELVACTKQSKEHESIVFVAARPMHVHTALLLLGVKNGNPAIRQQIGKENPRWVDLPPRGDPINVFFVVQNADQRSVERPVSDFVVLSKERSKTRNLNEKNGPGDKLAADSTPFPHTFVFAGSQLKEAGTGPRQYLAEKSGNVISIATFGDELLCLPEVQSHKNNTLMWRIKPNQLPKIGTKILLRLRPAKKSQNNKDNHSLREPPTK